MPLEVAAVLCSELGSPPPMSHADQPIFLSYASQDGAGARRLCEALRAEGIEVWFDQNELRGGDAWDAKIRRQIKQCALFVPVISRATNSRHEGYFRLEWRLGDQRTHLMGRNRPFIVPVAFDGANDANSDVPDSFLSVQWTQISSDQSLLEFAARIKVLLGPSPAANAPRGTDGSSAPVLVAPPPPPAIAPPKPETIAVMAFINRSTDPANDVFCEGVSEELIAVLSRVTGLRVAARTSSFSFMGRDVPVQEIGQRLGVAHVLEGSVRGTGQRLRINAQLVNAADGFQVWSGNFDRELSDIFAVQDEIAALIAQHLKLKLAAERRDRRTVIPQAHRHTLEGRHYWNQRTNDGFSRGEIAFLEALQIDPTFAPAHAGLADVYSVRAMYRLADGETGAGTDLARARLSARQALTLDPALGEAHATLGFVQFLDRKLADAAREFKLGFIANPNHAFAFQTYSWVLCCEGRIGEALEESAKAIALDPISFINVDRYGAQLALAGCFAEALTCNERAASLRADLFVGNLSERAPILLALGQVEEAVTVARAVRTTGLGNPYRRNSDADAIYVLRMAGFVAEAEQYGAEVLPRVPAESYVRGFILTALDRFGEALPFLARVPMILLPHLFYAKMWDAHRADSRFPKLMEGLGFAAEYALARESLRRTSPQ